MSHIVDGQTPASGRSRGIAMQNPAARLLNKTVLKLVRVTLPVPRRHSMIVYAQDLRLLDAGDFNEMERPIRITEKTVRPFTAHNVIADNIAAVVDIERTCGPLRCQIEGDVGRACEGGCGEKRDANTDQDAN